MRSRWTAGGDSCTPGYQKCGDTGTKRRPGAESPAQARYPRGRKIPRAREKARSGANERVAKCVEEPSGKAAMEYPGPVPETDTGGWGENPEAGGRSIVKELGKMAP